MSASFEFDFDQNGLRRRLHESIDVGPSPAEHSSPITQIYAAAWSMAHRDHELDKLFNFEFYQQ